MKFTLHDADLETAYSIMFGALLSAVVMIFEQYKGKAMLWRWLTNKSICALLAFCSLIVVSPHDFLDVYLYYCIAALLAYLLGQEAVRAVSQQHQIAVEKQRADQLQFALDVKTEEHPNQTITLKDGGKLIKIKAGDILYCQGAGDYVEVALAEKTILHLGTLAKIVESLPNYFIRVHRSYIVNAKHVVGLKRLASGTGELELTNK